MSFDFAHAAVAVMAILMILIAFAIIRPGYSFPYGVGTGRDRHYPTKTPLFDKKGNRISN